MKTRILTRADVARLVTMDLALGAVERAFSAHGRKEAQMPSKVYVELPEHAGDFRAMPAALTGAVGVKWVNSHPENPARFGLPAVMGVYILSDPATAAPLAVMDATLLTAYRTGAAAAIATRTLFPRAPRTVGFIGCGVQARFLLEAHRALFPGFECLGADASREAAERFARETGGRAVTVEEAAGCDVVVTSTPSRRPVVRREWIAPGAHINAMGADAHGKQELDPRILLDALVYLDDVDQAAKSGEVNVPLSEGTYSLDLIAGTLGEVLAGRRRARPEGPEGERAITVFDSTGLAVQDLALARALFDEARTRGVGLEVDLVS